MLEAEILAQSGVNHFYGHGHKRPAFVADVGFRAACSDVVVVRQIDIEDKFFRDRLHLTPSERFAVSRVVAIDRSNLETGGVHSNNIFSEAEKQLGGNSRTSFIRKTYRSAVA